MNSTPFIRLFLILLLTASVLSSCTSTLTTLVMAPAMDNLQQQPDLQLVCEGTPSYLLLIDSLIADDPDDTGLLTIGAKAYCGYIGPMIECGLPQERIGAMTDKAFHYGEGILGEVLGASPSEAQESFQKKLDRASRGDASHLFWAAFGWSVWVQQQQGAPAAMTHLGKIEALLMKIIELNEKVEQGGAHFLLGAYYGSRPAMLGGNPQKSRFHFERALQISDRNMLIYQTVYAETYARNTMNKALHNALLREVLDFQLQSYRPNMLANRIAQRKAGRLLEEQYFIE